MTLFFIPLSVVNADEYTKKMYDGLPDNSYVLYIPDGGGYIKNSDGSANFSQQQIKENNGIVLTVSEAKVRALQYDPYTVEEKTFPTRVRSKTLGAGQSTKEQVAGPGWQTSKYYYNPAPKTGAYLLWTSYKDSGVVYHSGGTIRSLAANTPTYVMSDINRGTALWGVAYKTWNAPRGTYILIANW